MNGNWVDVALLVGLLVVALGGWRAGVITTAASFAGFIGGALFGAWLIPNLLAESSWPAFVTAMATIAGMFMLGIVGQAILGVVGRTVRDAVDFKPIRLLDSASGMVVSILAFLLCSWMVLSVAASGSLGSASDNVRASRTFPLLDQVMAGPGGSLLTDARELLATIDLPSLPFNPATLAPVDDPGDINVSGAAQRTATESVVQVFTSSTRCSATSLGSGVVVGPQRVLTNAHVVAGAGRISVRLSGDRGVLGARLVYIDRGTDVAILAVPDLAAPAPRWVTEAPRGTDSAVAGYPGGGGLTVDPARVRGTVLISQDTGSGRREVYVFRGTVRPGNSGGALIDLEGNVIGLVFANAQSDDQTGFALTAAEARPAIEAGAGATDEVSSGACQAP